MGSVRFNPNTISFHYTDPNEISNIITSMKNRGSIHDISISYLCSSHIYIHLSDLFNMCIYTGIFPDRLKLARISPYSRKDLIQT